MAGAYINAIPGRIVRPRYNPRYRFHEEFIHPDDFPANPNVNVQCLVVYYELVNTDDHVAVTIDVRGILTIDQRQISAVFDARSVHFKIRNLFRRDIYFDVPVLSFEILPNSSHFVVEAKRPDSVTIYLVKKKPIKVKSLPFSSYGVKRRWNEYMTRQLACVLAKEDVDPVLPVIWFYSQLLYISDEEFYLQPPSLFKLTKFIENSTCNFVDLESLLLNLSDNVVSVNAVGPHLWFLGGVLLYKLQQSFGLEEVRERDNERFILDRDGFVSREDNLLKAFFLSQVERFEKVYDMKIEAYKFQVDKQFVSAIMTYTRALMYDPVDPRLYCNRAHCHYMIGSYQTCVSDAMVSMNLDPFYDKAYLRAIRGLDKLELTNLAEDVYHINKELCLEKTCWLGTIMYDGEYPLGVRCPPRGENNPIYYKHKLKLRNLTDLHHIRSIYALIPNAQRHLEARNYLLELARHSNYSIAGNAYYMLALITFSVADVKGTNTCLEACYHKYENHQYALKFRDSLDHMTEYMEVAFSNFFSDNRAKALEWIVKAIQRVEDDYRIDVYLYLMKGLLLNVMDRYEEAIVAFTEAIDLGPPFMTVFYYRAQSNFALMKIENAERDMNNARRLYRILDPTGKRNFEVQVTRWYEFRGNFFLKDENFESAILNYQLAILGQPRNVGLLVQYTKALMELRKCKETLFTINEALKKDPHMTAARLELVRLLLHMGNYDAALNQLDKIPDGAEGPEGHEEQKKRLLSLSIDLQGLMKKGSIAFHDMDYSRALNFYSPAVQISPGNYSLLMLVENCKEQISIAETNAKGSAGNEKTKYKKKEFEERFRKDYEATIHLIRNLCLGGSRDLAPVDRIEEPARVDRIEEPARVDRIEEPARVDRIEEPARVDRIEEPARVDRIEEPARVDRIEEPARVDRIEEPARVDRIEEPARVDRIEEPARVDRIEEPARVDCFKKPAPVDSMKKSTKAKSKKKSTPAESTPVESTQAKSKKKSTPAESTPVESTQAKSKKKSTPAESTPVESTQAKSKKKSTPAESTPAESTPAESTPAESTPAESTPAESTPAESTPAESTPVESTPVESTPVESTPVESTPVESTPVESTPVESTPVESTQAKSKKKSTPVESTQAKSKKKSTPVESTPVESAQAKSKKKSTPAESTPVESTQAKSKKKSTPAESTPVESTQAKSKKQSTPAESSKAESTQAKSKKSTTSAGSSPAESSKKEDSQAESKKDSASTDSTKEEPKKKSTPKWKNPNTKSSKKRFR